MKHTLISILFIIASNAYAQIGKSKKSDKITEIGSVERILGDYISIYSLSFLEKDGIKTYALAFTNEQTLYDDDSPDQKILIFTATQDEFDYFYNFLLEGFDEETFRYLAVGQDIVKTLPPINTFLYIYVSFKDGTSASLKLTKRQLAKLFGKDLPKKKGVRKRKKN